jgi:RNA polymerase sigma factor (sigma-70 family)
MILINESFLKKLKDKDSDSWGQIYKEYKSMIIKLVLKNSGSLEEAEDLFQNVMISLLKNIENGRISESSDFKNYIYTLAINQWRSKLKKGKNSPLMVLDNSLIMEDLLEEESETACYEDKLDAIYAQIKEKCLQLFQLRYSYQKRSMDEIAAMCGFGNAKSATSQLNKCMNTAKKIALAL